MKTLLFAVAGLMTCACGAEGMDQSEADGVAGNDEASPGTGQVQQAVSFFTIEFPWVQGQGPVSMMPATDGFCFLTRVEGDFEGNGEFVRVFPEGGVWKLHGQSHQSGVGAGARCVPRFFHDRRLGLTSEFSWNQGDPPKPMLADNGFTACLLTRVQGKFHGDGERVEITRSNGTWVLGGGSMQHGVGAGARCVTNVLTAPGTKTYSTRCISAAPPAFPDALCEGPGNTDCGAVSAGPELFGVCGLGKMSGKFEGGAERVEVFHRDNRWLLRAFGRQDSVYSTSAFCFL